MTYLVLARKWRPRSFDTLVGQDHVVRALSHALSTQRLHHAWLFTGTRGVGKTTLSRILAKSLNCESGITATPCGTCRACTEIDAGRFVDYLELDAASNRGVDEMTQLLEQAVYAPSSGRFKVYMIDEVHMLTGHAFNAMLKTLEEPPPHVKFILATTDPQKIPVTVLSRCLQFNLKQMAAESIVAHLQHILDQEAVPFQIPALRLLARAAAGSMRDALSLADQAIAYSAGNLTAEAVQGMLGTIDQGHLVALLQALAMNNAAQVLDVANQLASRGFSYSGALADLAVLLSRVAIEQRVSGSVPADDPLADDISHLAQTLHPDQIQLFYTVAVHSRSELSLAPDEYAGFVMACLRMLALVPPGSTPPAAGAPGPASTHGPGEQGTSAANVANAANAANAADAADAVQQPAARSPAPVPAAPQSSPVGQTTHSASAQALQSASMPTGQHVQPAATPAPHDAAHQSAVACEPVHKAVAPPSAASAAASLAPEPPPWDDEPDTSVSAEPVDTPGAADPVDTRPTMAPEALVQETYTESAERPDPFDPAIAGHDSDPDQGVAAGANDFDGFEPVDDIEASGLMAEVDDDFELPPTVASLAEAAAEPRRARSSRPSLTRVKPADWPQLAASLPVTGLASELARQSEWLGLEGDHLVLRVAIRSLAESAAQVRLQTVLSEHFGTVVKLRIHVGATGDDTAHAVAQARKAALQQHAEQAAQSDPFVQALLDQFDGRIVPGSIRPAADQKAA